jgi:ABC-type nitrate/sulfonate/bicarbonate transport system permease component
LVWFGLGMESKLALAFLVAFFPVVVDTATGLQATPPGLLELARSLRASPLQVFMKVQIPAALPFMFAGAKVAITLAVIGAVIGEFVGSVSGLGNLLLSASSSKVPSPGPRLSGSVYSELFCSRQSFSRSACLCRGRKLACIDRYDS